MQKTIYHETLLDIARLWYLNACIPKGYGIRSSDYDRQYRLKDYFIKKIIKNIKENQLPIKYGANGDVIYFSFVGVQVSFHHTGDTKIKKYKGKWQGNKIDVFTLEEKERFYKKIKRIARKGTTKNTV